jgi:hypothetical protein
MYFCKLLERKSLNIYRRKKKILSTKFIEKYELIFHNQHSFMRKP